MIGVLMGARSGRPTPTTLLWSAGLLGIGFTLAAVAATDWTFAAALGGGAASGFAAAIIAAGTRLRPPRRAA